MQTEPLNCSPYLLPFNAVEFHAFRRFRESVLKASPARDLLIDYWMGHANDEMGNRYASQLLDDRKFRAKEAKKIGLGFKIPVLSGIHGIQKQEQPIAA